MSYERDGEVLQTLHAIRHACLDGDRGRANELLGGLPNHVRGTLGSRLDSSTIVTLRSWGLPRRAEA